MVFFSVPLLISHPQSPFNGQHYREPVELVDVYPTLIDLVRPPYNEKVIYKDLKHIPPQGQSLAPVVLGKRLWEKYFPLRSDQVRVMLSAGNSSDSSMPIAEKNFAITQSTRCAKKNAVPPVTPSGAALASNSTFKSRKMFRRSVWEVMIITIGFMLYANEIIASSILFDFSRYLS